MEGIQTACLRERAVGERQFFHVAGDEAASAGETRSAQLQHVPGNIECNRSDAAAPQPIGHPARTRAQIEHEVRGRRRQHAQHHGKVEQVLGVGSLASWPGGGNGLSASHSPPAERRR